MIKNNKRKIKEKRELKAISFFEIILLVVATVAFSWMIGSQIETVSADGGSTSNTGCISAGGTCINLTANPTCIGEKKVGLCAGLEFTCCVPYSATIPEDEGDGITFGDVVKTAGKIGGGAYAGYKGIEAVANAPETIAKAKETIKGAGEVIKTAFSPKVGTPTAMNLMADASGLDSSIAADIAANEQFLSTIKPVNTGFFSGESATFSGVLGQVLMNAAAAAATALAINYFAKKFASDRNFNDIRLITWLSVAPAAGIGLIGMSALPVLASMGIAAGVVALAFAVYMLVGYQIYSRDTYTYRVSMWQAPPGGNDCEKCNALTVGFGENKVNGCSEYVCHTYGAACMWLSNNNDEDYETCIVGNPNDGAAPHIEPAREVYGEEVFPTSQYNYRSSASATKIIYSGEGGGAGQCIPAYTPIKIALTTHEEALCKISLEPTTGTPKDAFNTMLPMAEGTVYTKNHTIQLPSSVSATEEALENAGYSINNGGNYKFYVRCSDYWENINSVDYTLEFCVQMGPDRRPPEIIETNPATDSYIKAGTSYIEDFQVYTNEPADCKWDTRRVTYDYMNYNFSRCSQRIDDYIAGFDYGCRTNLTQFRNSEENRYYIACRDKPEYKGNVTKEAQRNTGTPYEVVLKGTDRLMIQTARINGKQNGTIIRSPESSADIRIDVLTSNGAEDGNAKCMYAINSNEESSYSLFTNEGSLEYLTTNTEELYMPTGFYNLNIKCFDIAGNLAETMINFTVELDNLSPVIIRAYKDESSDSLKIITDELAQCVYSTTSCTYNIEEAASIDSEDGINHYVEWDASRDLYIKCLDEYENQPFDGACSIILRPFEVAQII